MSQHEEQTPHRLFAAIVLMGTGLAVGCGGIAERDREESSGGNPGTSAAGTASSNAAGSNNVGATATAGGASATSTGGGPNLNIAGFSQMDIDVSPTVEPGAVGPTTCPPQQWTSTSRSEGCTGSGGFILPDDCACDLSRPRSSADCVDGLVLVCRRAVYALDNRPLTRPVDYDCVCAPKNAEGCQAECRDAYGRSDLRCAATDDALGVACSCAVVYLK